MGVGVCGARLEVCKSAAGNGDKSLKYIDLA